MTVEETLCFGALICAMAGAVADVRSRRIPNRLTVSALVSGFALHLILQGLKGLEMSAAGALIAGGAFFLLFVVGGMGAGDVKLMGAVGAWVGAAHALQALAVTAIGGGVLAIGWTLICGQVGSTFRNMAELIRFHLASGLRRHPDLNLARSSSIRLPYGPAIAMGPLYLICQRFWG